MKAKEFLDNGDLGMAIRSLNEEVKEHPSDLQRRAFLFELHCYAGDLARAERQLDVIRRQGAEGELPGGVLVYQDLLSAERARGRLFEEGHPPRFLLAPPAGVSLHLEALLSMGEERFADARTLLDRAAAELTPLRGTAGGTEFEGLRDADDALAPVLEVFSGSSYFWVPWAHIQYLEVPGPKNLLDLLWTPARLATFDGQLGEVFLPGLYYGSSSSSDDLLRLGRKTDWVDVDSGIIGGIGRKVFLVGEDARTLLELGEVRFTFDGVPQDAPASDAPGVPGDRD